MMEVVNDCEKLFTAEEGNGKFVDLHTLYMQFCNIKKLKKLNAIKADDYLTWLQNFDKVYLVPLYLKQSNKYEEYLKAICTYLSEFFKKSQPLIEWNKIEEQTEDMF
jgi:splicing factor 3A subunit 3